MASATTAASHDDLRGRIALGFRTSTGMAHGSANGAYPEPPVAVPEVPVPAILGQRPPDSLPKNGAPPAACRSNYQSTSLPSHKTRVFRGGDELLSQAEQRLTIDPQAAKAALQLESASNTKIGRGQLDDDVMTVYLDGKGKEQEHARTRKSLLSQPLYTPLPAPAKSSAEHCEMLSVHRAAANAPITRYAGEHKATSGLARLGQTEDLESTRQRVTGVANASASRRRQATDVESLSSTYREHFDDVDAVEVFAANARYATVPVLHNSVVRKANQFESSSQKLGSTARDDPTAMYATTYALNTIKPQDAERVDTKHHMHGSFNVVGGVRLISHQCHRPRETGATVASPTDIVPGHFSTMSASLQRSAVKR